MMCYVVHRTNVSSFIIVRYFTDHVSGDHVFELFNILLVGSILYLSPFLRYLTRLGFSSIIQETTRILLEGIFSLKLTRFLTEGDMFFQDIVLLFFGCSKNSSFTNADSLLWHPQFAVSAPFYWRYTETLSLEEESLQQRNNLGQSNVLDGRNHSSILGKQPERNNSLTES